MPLRKGAKQPNDNRKDSLLFCLGLRKQSCGYRICTGDLQVMSLTRYYFSNPLNCSL